MSETISPPPATAPSSRSALAIVFLVVVIDLLGFGIVLPLLPLYGESYVGPIVSPAGGATGTAVRTLGLLADPQGYGPLRAAASLYPAREDWRGGGARR